MDRCRVRWMDSLTERWTDRPTDIGTSGWRFFPPPLSPQSGGESLKSTPIGFYSAGQKKVSITLRAKSLVILKRF